MVEITPEIQKQLDEAKKQCPFCKIMAGEIESKKIYEDELMSGILDINPWINGHSLLMPKEHYPIMPFIPPETFKHFFGMMPKLAAAFKKSMLTTGFNVFIANGAVAGQQAGHFLVHLLARERGDSIFDKFLLNEDRPIEKEKADQVNGALANNMPIMMNNHFSKNPASWREGGGSSAAHLSIIKANSKVIYEDEKALCVIPEKPQCIGHLVVYSNESEKLIENLDFESASHIFYVASYCATAVFEGLGAQGTNIIMKSGESDDNPDSRLCIHILPRYQDDGIDVIPKPMQNKPNLDNIAKKIKDETFMIEYEIKEENKPKEVINLDNPANVITDKEPVVDEDFDTPVNEIKSAIDRIKK